MITITHLFYTRFTHSSLNNIFYTTINNIIILFKNFLPLRFFLLFKCISLGLWEATGDVGSIPVSEDPPEKGMAPHSRIPARGIPWTEELGGLQSIGSQSVGHDHSNLARMHTHRVVWSNCCFSHLNTQDYMFDFPSYKDF